MITVSSPDLFSRPLHGLRRNPILAINRWAIFDRPLKRGLNRTDFLGKAERSAFRHLRSYVSWVIDRTNLALLPAAAGLGRLLCSFLGSRPRLYAVACSAGLR